MTISLHCRHGSTLRRAGRVLSLNVFDVCRAPRGRTTVVPVLLLWITITIRRRLGRRQKLQSGITWGYDFSEGVSLPSAKTDRMREVPGVCSMRQAFGASCPSNQKWLMLTIAAVGKITLF
ncbi:hypothetical protein [Ensifer adhaerens]|uniref:hypothetical protein n=1 Tax=Ensifer adhaerens TaxID=106592 RepID=UPI00128E9C81|nr:hypothetical protein [Ensifer adhaerens]